MGCAAWQGLIDSYLCTDGSCALQSCAGCLTSVTQALAVCCEGSWCMVVLMHWCNNTFACKPLHFRSRSTAAGDLLHLACHTCSYVDQSL